MRRYDKRDGKYEHRKTEKQEGRETGRQRDGKTGKQCDDIMLDGAWLVGQGRNTKAKDRLKALVDK